ncbi:MAG: hypothetical protein ABI321_16440 [Polyangia bacterium]
MHVRLVAILALVVLFQSGAHANEAQEQHARALFVEGSTAFRDSHYDRAYDLFKQSYLLFPAPEFLFNMASALQAAGRPHEAAEALRAFLRVRPDANERVGLESRIRALEEAQKLMDAQRLLHDPAPELVAVPAKAAPPRWTRRKTLITTLATVGGVLVVGGIAAGITLGLHDWHTSSALGTHSVTP